MHVSKEGIGGTKHTEKNVMWCNDRKKKLEKKNEFGNGRDNNL